MDFIYDNFIEEDDKESDKYFENYKDEKFNIEYFEQVVGRLGSTFDSYIYESEAGEVGKEIVLKDEINLVKDYLNLEHIRYEERLSYDFKIAEDVQNCMIPPFMIQTQVENAIKHGISKLPGNGNIIIEAFKLLDVLKIKVSNTGKLNTDKPLTGIGFKNSIQRLELLYGNHGEIFINEVNNFVVVEINIPLK